MSGGAGPSKKGAVMQGKQYITFTRYIEINKCLEFLLLVDHFDFDCKAKNVWEPLI